MLKIIKYVKERITDMFKIIKKSLIIILLMIINTISYVIKIIHDFYEKNKIKIKKYADSFYCVLQEELEK